SPHLTDDSTSPTAICTLSLHDALPIYPLSVYYNAGQPFVAYPFTGGVGPNFGLGPGVIGGLFGFPGFSATLGPPTGGTTNFGARSEEHTSELQSLAYLVCRLLLVKITI